VRIIIAMMVATVGAAFADAVPDSADAYAMATGQELMEEVYLRHQQYPYVYEEQSMILVDQYGNKDTRKLRRYSRLEASGTANFLLLFDSPRDVKGMALLASQDSAGNSLQSFYLPAFGNQFIEHATSDSRGGDEHFLGTDYSVENLIGESLDHHKYIRLPNETIEKIEYYVINTHSPDDANFSRPLRRHYILKDTLFIARTDHFDELGRLRKRQTQHDITNVHGKMWRANMMMMDNQIQDHRTIIKIDKRVFSADYVPEDVFSQEWIIANAPRNDEVHDDEEVTELD
jgi:hypothetical protein